MALTGVLWREMSSNGHPKRTVMIGSTRRTESVSANETMTTKTGTGTEREKETGSGNGTGKGIAIASAAGMMRVCATEQSATGRCRANGGTAETLNGARTGHCLPMQNVMAK